jgi:hypothetical protein
MDRRASAGGPGDGIPIAASAPGDNGGAMLAQLVQKVSTFRRQLVAEKALTQEQQSTIQSQQDQIRDLEARLREKERALLDAVQTRTSLEQRLQTVGMQAPALTPQKTSAQTLQALQEFDRLLASNDSVSKQKAAAEMSRVREELSSLQWHHSQFEERTLAEKLQAEVSRAALVTEGEQVKVIGGFFFFFPLLSR